MMYVQAVHALCTHMHDAYVEVRTLLAGVSCLLQPFCEFEEFNLDFQFSVKCFFLPAEPSCQPGSVFWLL